MGIESSQSSKLQLAVFPNPAKDFITLSFSDGSLPERVAIYPLSGADAYIGRLIGNQLNISHLARGIYMLEASNGKESFKVQFVKE